MIELRRSVRTMALACAVVIVVASCSSSSSPTPAPTPTPAATATPGAASEAPTEAMSEEPTLPAGVVATVPDSALITPGILNVCQSVPSVPFLMYDENGAVTGTDNDTAQEIAKRLDLEMASVLSVFATMITNVQTDKCDIIVSSMDVRADREAQIDQIGYLITQAGLLFQYGNTHGIGDPLSDPLSLCGHKIVAEIGSQGLDQIHTWSKGCTDAGKDPIKETAVQTNDVLYQVLISGKADAAIGGPEPANYYSLLHPGVMESGPVYQKILEGVGVKKGSTDLENAIITALNSMKDDGTLLKIMQKYGLNEANIPDAFELNPEGIPVLGS